MLRQGTDTASGSTPKSQLLALFDPASMSDEVDVIHELTINRRDYTGGEWLSFPRLPGSVLTLIDRVKNNHKFGNLRPSRGAVVSCVLHYGVASLANHPDVAGLLEAKRRLDNTLGVDQDVIEELSSWFRSFFVGVYDSRLSTTARHNFQVPTAIKGALTELADGLGAPYAALGVVAMQSTFSTQRVAAGSDAARAVHQFMRRVVIRRRVAELLLDTAHTSDDTSVQ